MDRLRAIDQLLRSVPGARSETLQLRMLLEREADVLCVAHAQRQPAAAALMRGEPPGPDDGGPSDEALFDAPLAHTAAMSCMAVWHGFVDLPAALAVGSTLVDPVFETACDAIVSGDADTLRALLTSQPALARARSPFAHHQTLLQHVSANGIENSRQWQSPANAVELMTLLLDAGAEPDVRCDSYGGSTALTLLVSSQHPAEAGVQAALVERLCQGGARPDGPDDDGMPLCTAITSWYTAAIDALVRCGARIDNLLFAAAVGDLARVERYFDAEGLLRPDALSWGRSHALARVGQPRVTLQERHILEYALHWAAKHRRRQVVKLLLKKAPDFRVKEPLWGCSLLEAAHAGGDAECIAAIQPHFDEQARPRAR
ncbi:MAG: hypothetical protein ABW321_19940 [Polyangiales bacterium]